MTISLVLLDSFIGIIGTMTLVVAAMLVERRRVQEELLGMQSVLRAEVEGKRRELADTVEALDVELAGHARTKKSLRDNQEKLRLVAAKAALEAREVRRDTETTK
jgi:C4-dicarboxylate-specific signal transduction histidine kinase